MKRTGGGEMRETSTIGIDIGGTAIKLGIVGASGTVLSEAELDSPIGLSQQEAVAEIARAATELREALARRTSGAGMPCAVGMGSAGLVSSEAGVVHTSPNLPRWRDVPLAARVGRALNLPAFLLNDANAFTLAEARLGAGAGASPVVGVTLGTGVGGAIVLDGRLLDGVHGFAGEVGHMSVAYEGPLCPCGNRGCLELYVGRRGLVASYLRRAKWRLGEAAYELAGGDRDALDPRLLAAAAQRGDRAAETAFAVAGEILGVGLANLANLVDPQRFVVGGGVSRAGDLLLAPAERALRARVMMGAERAPQIRRAALGMSAGLIGAALYAADRVGDEERIG
ncbi:MAG: ROK family protein [Candidatus Eisenbacteria bacterium]|nr:ROK family protein [Candidatus Eisenbacteria bacterium]